jgi:citrate lyase subunit beta/citryl-CoA lyase
LLFVPGNRPERFAKAATAAADLVIVDLQDAVPQDAKVSARDSVVKWLSADGRGAVRVNGTRSVHYQQDVTALAGLPGLQAVVVPMADDEAMLMARSTLVVAASQAAGLPGPVDGVTTALDDPSRAGADAARARSLGFTGKLCIHPSQVEAVNAAFSPGTEEIAWAINILKVSPAGGVLRVDGHMVDAPVILRARRVLGRAKGRA